MDLAEGINAKISRAAESIEAIRSEVADFNKTNKYEISYIIENDAKEHVTIVTGNTYPPLKLSVLAGEALFHLRSSLDHLVYAIAQSSGHTPSDNSQFPICSSKEKFDQLTSSGNLSGVSQHVVDFIESKQPYNVQDPENSTLWLVQQLNNLDKHRLLNVVCAAARIGEEIVFHDNPGSSERFTEPAELYYISPPDKKVITRAGTEVVRLKFQNSCPDIIPKVEVKIEMVFDKCGTNNYVPLIDSIDKMKRYTEALTREIYAIL